MSKSAARFWSSRPGRRSCTKTWRRGLGSHWRGSPCPASGWWGSLVRTSQIVEKISVSTIRTMSNNDELELDVQQNKFVNSNGQWLLVGSALLITCYSVHSCHFTKLWLREFFFDGFPYSVCQWHFYPQSLTKKLKIQFKASWTRKKYIWEN